MGAQCPLFLSLTYLLLVKASNQDWSFMQLYAVPLTFLLIVLKLVVIHQSDSQYIGVNGAKQQSNYLHLLIDKSQYFSLD